ncbi:MAG TPA: hypothetical protein VGR47_12165 [Terracidiphilus sp.]|nr:hypothetical protein [Terracidiphilus sp.]
MYQDVYYVAYFGMCAALVVWLARMLRRFGAVFLRDAFRDRPEAERALGRLLETGLYLVGGGYLAITLPNYAPLHSPREVVLTIVGRLGGFLLLLGFLHLGNLLILAMVRQRALRVARTGELQ